MHSPDDTIVALSTPAGRGAIALLRLSGPEALDCARQIFLPRGGRAVEPARATLGEFVRAESRRLVDTGYLTFFPEGRSYTGQDVVELSCHASPVVVQVLLEELARAGARPADPGEFTYRAVLNGRLDLPQAEAVQDLIESGTRSAAGMAARHLRGDLSSRLDELKRTIVEIICRAEAAVEFAEEPDVQADGFDLPGSLAQPRAWLRTFLATYRQGRLLREGASVVLAGRPNAGKSSLFNHLLNTSRAIVAREPGTTRDFLAERIDLDGIPVMLVDTAGLRETAAGVERMGVERTQEWIGRADLVLLLCPVDEPLQEDDMKVLEAPGDRSALIGSKADLPRASWVAAREPAALVSSVTGEGVAALRVLVVRRLIAAPALSSDALVLGNARHHAALEACARALDRGAASLAAGMTEEVALSDLHAALRHLSEITEPVSRDAIHDLIFSRFCIGK